MEWVEITAKTVEAAKERALDELGIDHDEAEFVVLEEPRRGLFHQVRGTARVRARVAPRTPRPKAERRPRRGRGGASDETPRSGNGRRGDAKKAKGGNKSTSRATAAETGERSDGDAPRQESTEPSAKKTRTGGSTRSKKASNKPEGKTMTMTLDEQVAATESFLSGLLDAIGLDGRITTERTDDANAHVNIEGENLGLLIGPGGQTMNAIQDLARVTLQKQAAGSWEGHVHVDVNGYRAKRRAALVTFVEKVAADVVDSGTPKALEPMSSSDRKVVHDTVNGIDGVHTTSEGHEPRRWVMIAPDED